MDTARAERERRAYDEGAIDAAMEAWHGRFPHVFACPNTARHERLFDEETRRAVGGRRVIDIGCGPGASSARLLELGAAHVRGIDVSAGEIAKARRRGVPGRLEFDVADATRPLDGVYDAIFGRSILHHLDFRGLLPRLYRDNLAPGGTLLFMEPQGGNLLVRAYARFVPAGHTDDERSLQPGDLVWLRSSFERVELRPINYVSFPLALASSRIWPRADNAVLRWADRVDVALARRPRMAPRFRQTMIVIRKPGA